MPQLNVCQQFIKNQQITLRPPTYDHFQQSNRQASTLPSLSRHRFISPNAAQYTRSLLSLGTGYFSTLAARNTAASPNSTSEYSYHCVSSVISSRKVTKAWSFLALGPQDSSRSSTIPEKVKRVSKVSLKFMTESIFSSIDSISVLRYEFEVQSKNLLSDSGYISSYFAAMNRQVAASSCALEGPMSFIWVSPASSSLTAMKVVSLCRMLERCATSSIHSTTNRRISGVNWLLRLLRSADSGLYRLGYVMRGAMRSLELEVLREREGLDWGIFLRSRRGLVWLEELRERSRSLARGVAALLIILVVRFEIL